MRFVQIIPTMMFLASVAAGQDFYRTNDSLLSIQQFNQVKQNSLIELAAHPQSIEANYFLALVTIRQASDAGANSLYENNPYIVQFETLYRQYAREKDLMYRDQIMAADTRFVKLFFEIGLMYFSQQQFAKSAEWLNLARIGYMDNFDFNFYAGCSNFAIKNYDKAKTYFEEALRINPNDAATVYNFACMYSILNNLEDSIKWLQKAISLDNKYRDKARSDSDFDNIRATKQFQELTSQ